MLIRDKFLAVRDELHTVLLERSAAIDNALLALVSGEHFLQLGPPGTGKSLLVRELCKRIQGAAYFEKLMSAFTTPEEIFGPVDLVRYAEQGQYVRIAHGALSQAHIGFLDEIYKANSAILNSLLAILNERVLHEVGMPPQQVPLLSLFAASNETPQDSSLRALDDRFLLREVVQYLSDEQSFYALVAGQTRRQPVHATLTLADIAQAQQEAANVKGTMDALQALWQLRGELSQEGILVSDRKMAQCGTLLKAKAWLDGQDEMDREHLVCLVYALWTEPKEQTVVTRKVYELACPLALRAVEAEDNVAELVAKLPKPEDPTYNAMAENALQQVVDVYNSLKTELSQSTARNADRARQALTTIHAQHKAISAQLFKSVSKLSLAV
jgi:MoxR-like ATPase